MRRKKTKKCRSCGGTLSKRFCQLCMACWKKSWLIKRGSSDDDIENAKEALVNGATYAEAGQIAGVSRQRVHQIAQRIVGLHHMLGVCVRQENRGRHY